MYGDFKSTSCWVRKVTCKCQALNGSMRTQSDSNSTIWCFLEPSVGKSLTGTINISVKYPEGTKTCSVSHANAVSHYPPYIKAMSGQLSMSTAGGSHVAIEGQNFGPVSIFNSVSASYSWENSTYNSSCVLYNDTMMNCVTEAGKGIRFRAHCHLIIHFSGVGASLEWKVHVGGQTSNGYSGSSYAAPRIFSLSGALSMSTTGSEYITVHGSSFGPYGAQVSAFYGSYKSSTCSITSPQTTVVCATVEGVGANYSLYLVIGGQDSNSSRVLVSYKVPTLTSVSGTGASESSTAGGMGTSNNFACPEVLAGDAVVIRGSNFGPKSASGNYSYIVVDYGGSKANLYTAVDCQITVPHYQLECETGVGTGKSFMCVPAI
jgi:hypothetical protein